MLNIIKLKALESPNKIKKGTLYARKKTYDYRNFINLDQDTSEMDVNIKTIPTIRKKNTFIEKPVKIDANNFPIILKKKNCFNISKVNHCNSITTNTSYREKPLKKVTFSTVEIIRVEKYKKYNLACNYSKNLIKKNMDEIKNNCNNENESICMVF